MTDRMNTGTTRLPAHVVLIAMNELVEKRINQLMQKRANWMDQQRGRSRWTLGAVVGDLLRIRSVNSPNRSKWGRVWLYPVSIREDRRYRGYWPMRARAQHLANIDGGFYRLTRKALYALSLGIEHDTIMKDNDIRSVYLAANNLLASWFVDNKIGPRNPSMTLLQYEKLSKYAQTHAMMDVPNWLIAILNISNEYDQNHKIGYWYDTYLSWNIENKRCREACKENGEFDSVGFLRFHIEDYVETNTQENDANE